MKPHLSLDFKINRHGYCFSLYKDVTKLFFYSETELNIEIKMMSCTYGNHHPIDTKILIDRWNNRRSLWDWWICGSV